MLWRKRLRTTDEDELRERWNQISLEKGDIPAMMIAAFITLFPVVLLVGGVFALVIWGIFLR